MDSNLTASEDKMKILLLEDDLFICEQLKDYFELEGHKLDFYANGKELLDNAVLSAYDIFLFDINTPVINGFETLKLIRKDGIETPVVYITAQDDIDHIKKGFELGCNDYLKKPFLLEELEIRINAILHKNANDDKVKISPNYAFDVKNMNLYFKGDLVKLNKQEKSLLYILVKNIGLTIDPNTIKDYVWDEKDVCDNTLRTQIKKIREKLNENFIINVRNIGYKIEKHDQD